MRRRSQGLDLAGLDFLFPPFYFGQLLGLGPDFHHGRKRARRDSVNFTRCSSGSASTVFSISQLLTCLKANAQRQFGSILSCTRLKSPRTCFRRRKTYSFGVKLLLENLPPSLQNQSETLAKCLEAMNRVLPLKAVYLFGSHARGEARPDSDVDLCLVAEGATQQLKAAQRYRKAIWEIRPKPAFTLVPIAPQRLEEKKRSVIIFSRPS